MAMEITEQIVQYNEAILRNIEIDPFSIGGELAT